MLHRHWSADQRWGCSEWRGHMQGIPSWVHAPSGGYKDGDVATDLRWLRAEQAGLHCAFGQSIAFPVLQRSRQYNCLLRPSSTCLGRTRKIVQPTCQCLPPADDLCAKRPVRKRQSKVDGDLDSCMASWTYIKCTWTTQGCKRIKPEARKSQGTRSKCVAVSEDDGHTVTPSYISNFSIPRTVELKVVHRMHELHRFICLELMRFWQWVIGIPIYPLVRVAWDAVVACCPTTWHWIYGMALS